MKLGIADWLAEVVVYGGLRVRRLDMELHLNHVGVTGPARLRYSFLPAVAGEPEEVWDPAAGRWQPVE